MYQKKKLTLIKGALGETLGDLAVSDDEAVSTGNSSVYSFGHQFY